MNVRYVNLPPELLAAVSAMYSRSDLGIDAILAQLGLSVEEAAKPAVLPYGSAAESIVKRIMSFAVDYGHRSITGLTGGLAVFMDGLSMFQVFELFHFCQTGAGQETSTRYCKFSREGVLPNSLSHAGNPSATEEGYDPYWAHIDEGFALYNDLYAYWDTLVRENPSVLRLPQEQVDAAANGDAKAKKLIDRLTKNFAFDRARYTLPIGALTNVVLNVSAQGWIDILAWLNSHYRPEAIELGRKITEVLKPVIPDLLRHVDHNTDIDNWLVGELNSSANIANARVGTPVGVNNDDGSVSLSVFAPSTMSGEVAACALAHHSNRYMPIGSHLHRTAVRFDISNLAMAELRDLNRHRPGNRWTPLVPVGVYCAGDQSPDYTQAGTAGRKLLARAEMYLLRGATKALELLRAADPSYIWWTSLGTQYMWEHVLPADKFIYLAELRTGMGVHYRYCAHIRALLRQWYEIYPETRGRVLEGGAEPE